MRAAAGLSELEGCALGVVWRRGPCSAYAVKREFELSSSSSWSGSAGAVYPLINKLERLGLITGRDQRWRGRTKRLFELTAKGRHELLSWIADLPSSLARVTSDPIRTRAFFLDALSTHEDRMSFLAQAETNTAAAVRQLHMALEEPPRLLTEFERLASLGALYELRARARWLAHMRRRLNTKNVS